MKEELAKLQQSLCTWDGTSDLTAKDWEKISQQTTVVLMAGGESSRFREVAGSAVVNKNAFQLPNGDTMAEMSIRMYRDAGIKNFVGLVRDNAQSIIDVLGNGEKLGVKIDYCYDPTPPAGKGGALRHAYEENKLPNDNYLIIHNPDDVILDFEESFPKYILSAHINAEKKGALMTVVVCEGSPYQYTGMAISKGKVTNIEMYPFVPIPAHIGVTIFSPGLKNIFSKEFDYAQKTDFEKTLFPKLSAEGKLFAVGIPYDNWIPVNNLKNYKQLLSKLGL